LRLFAAQQIDVDPFEVQFPLWHSTLVVHAFPLAILFTHVPLPSHAWGVAPDPQVVPMGAAAWPVQACFPVLQEYVPGLQVVPQPPPALQETHIPLPSQTRFIPQPVPAAVFVWLQTAVPVLQLYVPG
jgi:hypothetical protein